MTVASAALEPVTPLRDEARVTRRLQRLAAILAIAAVAQVGGILLIAAIAGPQLPLRADLATAGFLASTILFPVMGALIAQSRPRTRVAWLMIALGLNVGFGLLIYGYGVIGLPPHSPLPFALEAVVGSQLFLIPALAIPTTLLILLFPEDRLISPRWRIVALISVVGAVIYDLASLVRTGELDHEALPGIVNPIAAPAALANTVTTWAAIGNLLATIAVGLATVSLVVRYRRAGQVERAQIRWLALVAALAAVAFAVSVPNAGPISDLGFEVGLCLLATMPIAIGIAITRYRLYDIDRLINRALVYASLSAILAGVFTAGIGLAQRLFVAVTNQTSDAAIVLATLVVATLYAPLRKRLESLVDRLFKYEAREFGAYRAELTSYLRLIELEPAARRLASEAMHELEAAGAGVIGRSEEIIATVGSWPQSASIRLPIGRAEAFLGTLVVGPRRDGKAHDPRDVDKLAELAMLAGAAIRRG